MGSAVLVTGGAGYIGSVTVERLAEAGRKAVVLDDLSRGHRSAVAPGVPLVVGDVGDRDLLPRVIAEHGVDSVIHFAAQSVVPESLERPGDYYRTNVVAGCALLEAMASAGVRKMVFSSSAGVYGEPESVPIRESHRTNPLSVYGDTKLVFERVLEWRSRSAGLQYVSLRYFNAAGASARFGEDHRPETHLIPNALRAAASAGADITVFGNDYDTPDGTCIRDYVDVRDLADAHIAALAALDRGRSGVYNLGSGEGWSVLNVLDAVSAVTGKRIPYAVGPRREGDPARLVASSSLAERELGWKPRHHELGDMIESAWAWARRFPEGYPD
jgi:UDP-glucose-4-epimerase GalE